MKALWIMILLTLIASGCQNTDTNQQSNKNNLLLETEDNSVSDYNESNDSSNLDDETNQEPLKPLYYMNENYIIKPIDNATESKVVLLTFDDGPKDESLVNQMLDILDKHQVKAIFFVNGYRVDKKPELLVQIHERGQVIGNHSWDHVNLSELDVAAMNKQVLQVQDSVERLTGERPKFFRPPFGTGNVQLRQYVKEQNMLYMHWSNGSLDWSTNQNDAQGVVKSIFEQLHRGSNILMHELPWTVEALDTLIKQLKDEGYHIVDPNTISHDHR